MTSARYQTDPAYRAHVDAIAAGKPEVTPDEVRDLRQLVQAGRTINAHQRPKAS